MRVPTRLSAAGLTIVSGLPDALLQEGTASSPLGTAPGIGTSSYIVSQYFVTKVAKIEAVQVPFQGGAPAITALMGNHVGNVAGTLPPFVTHINQGTLKGLGIAAPNRHPLVPSMPSRSEARTSFSSSSCFCARCCATLPQPPDVPPRS